jgi:glycosyltransferase involved in cell wall biosynthesis
MKNSNSFNMLKYSIVVPTRNRHETLLFTLKNLLSIEYSNYEIVVFDNASDERIDLHLAQIKDERIKYFRSDKPLAMSDSWEMALGYAMGEFVTIIGDDDGLMPETLRITDYLIELYGYQIISWDRIFYNWPEINPEYLSNIITIPTKFELKINNSIDIVRRVLESDISYTELPMLYNSVIKKSIIDKIKHIKGRFFLSVNPDIYSGYVLALFSDEYLRVNLPLSVNGGSKSSNGIAWAFNVGSKISSEFSHLNKISSLKLHESSININSSHAQITEPLFHAEDVYDIKMDFNRDIYLKFIVQSLRFANESEREDQLDKLKIEIKRLGFKYNHIQLALVIDNLRNRQTNLPYYDIMKGLQKNKLVLNALDWQVYDVSEAVHFCDKLLKINIDSIKRLSLQTPKYRDRRSLIQKFFRKLKLFFNV